MSKNNEKAVHETLREAINELIRLIKSINTLEQEIDETYGVRLVTTYINGSSERKGDVNVWRGIEEIENALGREAKFDGIFYSNETKRLRHNGIEFTQYADVKTKTFVKAGKETPKIVIVEE